MNDDWDALCAIYGAEDGFSDDQMVDVGGDITCTFHDDERQVRLMTSEFGGGFCGTVFMTLSTKKVAFARRVNDAGNYRFFVLEKSPILKLDLLYTRNLRKGPKDEHDDDDFASQGPSGLRLKWEYYPKEWPDVDKEAYRSCLAKKCNGILQEQGMSFAICEFLEHQALSLFRRSSDFDDGWKNYVDPNHPDYQLIILPPEMDRMYQPTLGTLIHPQHEAAVMERRTTMQKRNGKRQSKNSTYTITAAQSFATPLEFGKHAMIHFWKELYTTTCPICLDDSVLFSEGIVLPFCQHYSCRDCFQMYLKYKVQDLKEFRTNPFVCPVETCKRELPIVGYCKQFLSNEDMDTVRDWYKDLKHPPCWSLDRCLYTKTCGAIGSMRRRRSGIPTAGNKNNLSPAANQAYEEHLVYCETCDNTWCELCLKRVYYDNDSSNSKKSGGNSTDAVRSTPFNHRWHCEPQGVIKLCRRYMAASEEKQQECQEKFPWIQSYSLFCQHDGEALQYIIENGQRCPNCQTGVERTEGCFHMKCPTCATHFCYECGTELFPPYYGTHHCWEEEEPQANGQPQLNFDTDEQYALALYLEQAI
jgi:hypothetical protein